MDETDVHGFYSKRFIIPMFNKKSNTWRELLRKSPSPDRSGYPAEDFVQGFAAE
jgi:hypothetical protein